MYEIMTTRAEISETRILKSTSATKNIKWFQQFRGRKYSMLIWTSIARKDIFPNEPICTSKIFLFLYRWFKPNKLYNVRCGIRTHAHNRGPEIKQQCLKSGAFDRSANLFRLNKDGEELDSRNGNSIKQANTHILCSTGWRIWCYFSSGPFYGARNWVLI